jgi:H+/Cl- antiporter ClcA
MQHPGWVLIVVGVLIAVIGLVWLLASSVPWLGKLPGDIVIERENFRFYFPVTTCVLLSLLLTGIMWVVRHFSR